MRFSRVCSTVVALLIAGADAPAGADDTPQTAFEPAMRESQLESGPYFPNSAGSYWTYIVQWPLPWDRIDTIQVTVDTATLSGIGKAGTVWTNAPWRQIALEGFYTAERWAAMTSNPASELDTVAFFGSTSDTTPDLFIVLPLEVGTRWKWLHLGNGADSSFEGIWVDSVTEVETPCGTFTDVIHLTRRYFKPYGSRGDLNPSPSTEGLDGKIEYWIKPGVGLVRIDQVHKARGTALEIRIKWELLEYHIAGVDPHK